MSTLDIDKNIDGDIFLYLTYQLLITKKRLLFR